MFCHPLLGPDSMLTGGDNSCTQSRPQISVAQLTIIACRLSSEISVLSAGFCLKGMVKDSDELLSTIAVSLMCGVQLPFPSHFSPTRVAQYRCLHTSDCRPYALSQAQT